MDKDRFLTKLVLAGAHSTLKIISPTAAEPMPSIAKVPGAFVEPRVYVSSVAIERIAMLWFRPDGCAKLAPPQVAARVSAGRSTPCCLAERKVQEVRKGLGNTALTLNQFGG